MNKDMRAVARQMERGKDECGICHDGFKTVLLRAVLHENTVKLVCPGCIQNVPNARRSSLDVGQIIALKETIRNGSIGGDGSHWDGCHLVHRDCASVKLEQLSDKSGQLKGPDLDSLNTWTPKANSGESAIEGKP